MGRDSAVGMATRYQLDGQGIQFLLGQYFPRPSRPAILLLDGYRFLFPGVQRLELGFAYNPNLATRLKKGYSCTFTFSLGVLGLFLGEIRSTMWLCVM